MSAGAGWSGGDGSNNEDELISDLPSHASERGIVDSTALLQFQRRRLSHRVRQS